MWATAVLASAMVRLATVLTWACSSRRWLGTLDAKVTLPTIDPEPTIIVECASCRPSCWLLERARPSFVEGGPGGGDGGASGIGGYGFSACTPATGWWCLVTTPANTIRSEGPGGGGEHVPHATGHVVRAMELESQAEGCAEK